MSGRNVKAMSEAMRQVCMAYESNNTDACVEAMGRIQESINALTTWFLEREEAEKVKDARAELAPFVKGD